MISSKKQQNQRSLLLVLSYYQVLYLKQWLQQIPLKDVNGVVQVLVGAHVKAHVEVLVQQDVPAHALEGVKEPVLIHATPEVA